MALMTNKMKWVVISLLTIMCGACTTVSVKPVDQTETIHKVCIKLNTKVIVSDFTDILAEGFSRHGIETKVYSEIPSSCKYWLTYTANQSWDMVLFLRDAHMDLYKNDLIIAYADRNAPKGIFGGGGVEISKWDSTREKVDPMIDELLKNFPQSH